MGTTRRRTLLASFVAGGALLAVGSAAPRDGNDAEAATATPARVALVELGRRLFFDPVVSLSGLRSCADCHVPEHGFSDPRAKSLETVGDTPHHTQTLIDVADAKTFHWHGELKTIGEVARARMTPLPSMYYQVTPGDEDEPTTPGDPDPRFGAFGKSVGSGRLQPADAFVASPFGGSGECVNVVRDAGRYREAFVAAFGTSTPSQDRIESAIDAYCRSIRSGTSAFDRFAGGDASALSPSARRGLELFRGKAACATCHLMNGERATFSDQRVHDLHAERALAAAPLSPRKSGFVTFASGERARKLAEEAEERLHQWKTPTLRDVALRGPYFHTGLAATLEDAIRFFRPPDATPGVVPADKPWTDEQVADLAAFLRSLSSERRPGIADTTWGERSAKKRLRFLDAFGNPLRGFDVSLLPAGDALPLHGELTPIRLQTNENGVVSFETPLFTHVRVQFDGGLLPFGGPLVPDSCRAVDVRIPIRGRACLSLTLPKGMTTPETLVAEHPDANLFPDRKLPYTLLRRESVADGPRGAVVANYTAAMRTDVPADVVVKVGEPFSAYNVTFRRNEVVPLNLAR